MVFSLSRNAFMPGAAYTAADGGPFVGTLDMTTGVVTPVVTGLNGPGGRSSVILRARIVALRTDAAAASFRNIGKFATFGLPVSPAPIEETIGSGYLSCYIHGPVIRQS